MLKQTTSISLFLLLALSSVAQAQLAPAVEAKANKLFEQLMDEDNDTMSWRCFAQLMANILSKAKQPKYKQLAQVFTKLKDLQSAKQVGEGLEPHAALLPAEARETLNSYTKIGLWRLINWRIGLNNKVNCQKLKSELNNKVNCQKLKSEL